MPAVQDQATALRRIAHREAPTEVPTRRCPVIAIASGKGGVGKTTVAVSIAIGLASRGLKTALVDADLGLANADLICGLRPTARLTEAVAHVSRGGTVTADLVRRICTRGPRGVVFVPGMVGPLGKASMIDARTAVMQTVDVLQQAMDVVVVDHGAGLGASVREGLASSAYPIAMATPDPASLADAYALVKSLRGSSGSQPPRVLINRTRSEAEAQAAHARIAEVAAKFLAMGLPMIGHVPEDPAVSRCARMRRPLPIGSPKSQAWKHLDRIIARLADEIEPAEAHRKRSTRPRGLRLARFMRAR
mgnify:CR=1 FL=1